MELSCEAHPQHRFTGSIDFVGEVLDPHSRTISARAVIDNAEGRLKPGMFVYAQIEHATGDGTLVLLVPSRAVTEIDGRDVVFVEAQARSFQVREVAVAPTAGRWREVLGGITAGERIAVEGVFLLKSEVLKGGLEGHDH